MPTDYGKDVAALPDLDERFVLRSGNTVLVESIARRYTTRRGGLFYDQNYGLDLRDFLNEAFTPKAELEIRAQIAAEAIKDRRVRRAQATVAFNRLTKTMQVTIRIQPLDGPTFDMVLAVTAVTVALLKAA
jgi:phage baseplate assembly protein W